MSFVRKAGATLALSLTLFAAPCMAQPIGQPGPTTVSPDEDDGLQMAAAVGQVDRLTHQGDMSPTLFTIVGDTALNGVDVYLAFDGPPDVGSRVFRIADLSDYHILSETRGRLLLAVVEEVGITPAGNDAIRQRRRILVTWTPGPDGTAPATVTVREVPTPRQRRR